MLKVKTKATIVSGNILSIQYVKRICMWQRRLKVVLRKGRKHHHHIWRIFANNIIDSGSPQGAIFAPGAFVNVQSHFGCHTGEAREV